MTTPIMYGIDASGMQKPPPAPPATQESSRRRMMARDSIVTLKVSADTTELTAALDVVVKHLKALSTELKTLRGQPEH